jgi:hypothetical protein
MVSLLVHLSGFHPSILPGITLMPSLVMGFIALHSSIDWAVALMVAPVPGHGLGDDESADDKQSNSKQYLSHFHTSWGF